MKKFCLIAITTLLSLAAFGPTVFAQTPSMPLIVAPARQEIFVDPGKKDAGVIKFINQGSSPISGTLSVVDFIVDDKEGSPDFIDNNSVTGKATIPSIYSGANWVSLPYDRISIPANDKVTIPFTVTVPNNAASGGRYVAIIFEPGGKPKGTGADKEAETPVSIRLAGLVYINVSGPVYENAFITAFDAPNFSEFGPITLTTEITNKGNYHIKPTGTVTIKNLFGQVVGKEKLPDYNVFPGTARKFETKVGEKWMLGEYTANLVVSYGKSGRVLTSATTFWVIPVKAVAAVILAIIILLLLVITVYKGLKGKQIKLEKELEEEKSELEILKEKYQDKLEAIATPNEDVKAESSKSEKPEEK